MVKCPQCSDSAKSKAGLASHIRSKHGTSDLVSAGQGGDRREILVALLKKLTLEADSAKADELPALSRQINVVSKELAALKPKEKSSLDRVRDKRARRRAKTARR